MLFFNNINRGMPEVPYLDITYDVYYPYKMFQAVRFIETAIKGVNEVAPPILINKWSGVIYSDIGGDVPDNACAVLARTLELQTIFNKGFNNHCRVNEEHQQYSLPLIRKLFANYDIYNSTEYIHPTYPATIELDDMKFDSRFDCEILSHRIKRISKGVGSRGMLMWFHDSKLTVFK